MKAKEYYKLYQKDSSTENVGKIAFKMFEEMKEIANQRKAKSNGAMYSIFEETKLKWRAFVRLTKDQTLKLDGFENLVRNRMPEIHFALQMYKDSLNMRRQ